MGLEPPSPELTIRAANPSDEAALQRIDDGTWSGKITPATRWPPDRRFFARGVEPEDVLIAEIDGAVIGYAHLQHPTEMASNSHVLEVRGLAVAPAHQRRGVARQLLAAAIEEAADREVCRLTLRVLASNVAARKLYASLGFEVEGVLHGEFLIDSRYVDDVLMAVGVGDALTSPC